MEEINHGVILGSGTENLYIGGTIPYQIVNESGDWRPYAPKHEKQRDPLETMACVSFSCNNCIEIQYNFYGDEPNFSDRFLAKMSGTTPQGNWCDRVADTARKIGLVKEEEWPNNRYKTWAEYYAEIPQSVKDKAVPQPILYEGVTVNVANLKKELKHAPLQIVIPSEHPNHAVTLVYINGNTAHYLDHYLQKKTIEVTRIASALKIVLTKSMNQTKIVVGKDGKTLYKAIPIATDYENFKKQSSVEGIEIPNPIPPASSL